jgi:hypothetical protein
VAIVSSGVGLSGVKAAITELLPKDLGIHVFYGIRDLINLPYLNFWQNLVAQKRLTFTLLVSGHLGEESGRTLRISIYPFWDWNSMRLVSMPCNICATCYLS